MHLLLVRLATVAILTATGVFVAVFALAWLTAHPKFGKPLQASLLKFKPLLECRFPRTAVEPGKPITGLVVLGGHTSRVEAAAKVLAEHPEANVIFSGQRYNELTLVAKLAVPRARLAIDHQATNTYENAVFSNELADPKPGERWLLVTSALHMPRAIGTFRAQGFPIEAWPVDDALPRPHITAPIVLHELMGLAAYYAIGRTSALFPEPVNTPIPSSIERLHATALDRLHRSCVKDD